MKWWARIIHVTWKVTCLYGIFTGCVWMHAHILENHWQCECSKSDDPGTNAGTHYPCIFRNLCVKGALVFSGVRSSGQLWTLKSWTPAHYSNWKQLFLNCNNISQYYCFTQHQIYVIYVSFILDAGGRPHTEGPQGRLIRMIKQMTFQEIPYVDNGFQLSL